MLVISPAIKDKLKTKHGVSKDEVVEAFSNRDGAYVIDDREEHKTTAPFPMVYRGDGLRKKVEGRICF